MRQVRCIAPLDLLAALNRPNSAIDEAYNPPSQGYHLHHGPGTEGREGDGKTRDGEHKRIQRRYSAFGMSGPIRWETTPLIQKVRMPPVTALTITQYKAM